LLKFYELSPKPNFKPKVSENKEIMRNDEIW